MSNPKPYLLIMMIITMLSSACTAQLPWTAHSQELQHKKEYKMERVLIDTFIVPEESRDAFLLRAKESASYLKTLPGYLEGFIYVKKDGPSQYNVVTTAVWKDEKALEEAKSAALVEFKKRNFNPQEVMAKLGVHSFRAIYDRTPY